MTTHNAGAAPEQGNPRGESVPRENRPANEAAERLRAGFADRPDRDHLNRRLDAALAHERERADSALGAFVVWAESVIPMLGDTEAADFGRDRIEQARSVLDEVGVAGLTEEHGS